VQAYYIVNFRRAHTRSDHRKATEHGAHWISVPTRHDTRGYKRVARLVNPHATATEIMMAYVLMAEFTATLPDHMWGWLVDRDGRPLMADDLEDLTMHPARIFRAAFEELVFERIGWLALRELPDFAVLKRKRLPEETGDLPEASGLRTDVRTDDTATASGAHPAPPVRCGLSSAPLRAGAVGPARVDRGVQVRPAPPRPIPAAADSSGKPDARALAREQVARLAGVNWASACCDRLAEVLHLGCLERAEQEPAMSAQFQRVAVYENRGELAAELIRLAKEKRGRPGVRNFWAIWQSEGDKLIRKRARAVASAGDRERAGRLA